MSDIQKIKIGEQEYTLTDGNALPVPATAQVGQTVVVAAVDDSGKPTAWKAATLPSGSSNVIVANFETGGVDTSMCCTTHTAMQLFTELEQSRFPVLANVYDRYYQTVRTAVCWIENGDHTTYVKVGCWGGDTGWAHAMGNEDCYLDGDPSNQTIGNELWTEY